MAASGRRTRDAWCPPHILRAFLKSRLYVIQCNRVKARHIAQWGAGGHRITECHEWERTHKDHRDQLLAPPKNQTMSSAMTLSLGSLFECLTTLSAKNIFLISNLNCKM